jgi:hypothetical protein
VRLRSATTSSHSHRISNSMPPRRRSRSNRWRFGEAKGATATASARR